MADPVVGSNSDALPHVDDTQGNTPGEAAMPPSDAGSPGTVRLSVNEVNLLLLLNGVGVKHYEWLTGKVCWALDAEDVCSVVEMAFYLFQEWCPTSPLDAWDHTARLLGVPVLPRTDAVVRPVTSDG